MSYDLGLHDPITKAPMTLTEPHHMRGGTYQICGCPTAEINVTYNYYPHLVKAIPEVPSDSRHARDGVLGGIRRLYGMTGAESIPLLEEGIAKLADNVNPAYWASTEGNAKRALQQCLALARMCPDGVWDGD